MTLKKPSRAGLMALAFGILLGLFLSVAAYNTSYAQTPAPSGCAGGRTGGPGCTSGSCCTDAGASLRQRPRS